MVAPIRELANNTFSTLSNISSYTTLAQTHSNLSMDDIDIGSPRGRSSLFSTSNSSVMGRLGHGQFLFSFFFYFLTL